MTPSALPGGERVRRTLEDRISRGHYGSGAWLPAERALAAELAASRAAVREALSCLSNQGLIVRSPGCRPRIAVAARRAGSSGARTPVRARSAIALVVPHEPTYVWAHAILRGVSQVLRYAGNPYALSAYDTFPLAARPDFPAAEVELERNVIERIEQAGAAGIVIWQAAGAANDPVLKRLHEAGTPVVYIDREPEGFDCDYVGVDNRAGTRGAVEYLVSLGHRRIGYLTYSSRVSVVVEREEGYLEGLAAAGIRPRPELMMSPDPSLGIDPSGDADHLASMTGPPTALMTVSDKYAFALIRELRARGIRVPEDMSVVGFDDIEQYSPHPAVLTTVHQPFEQVGEQAARLLLRRLSAPRTPQVTYQHVILPTSLVLRTTCAPPRRRETGQLPRVRSRATTQSSH